MANWEDIRSEWEITKITLSALAEKHSIKLGTLKSRKSREGWSRDPTKKDATKSGKEPSNSSIKNSTRTVLNRLVEKDPKGIDPSWVEKLDKGMLTESDATGLLFVAIDRGLIQDKKE
ncbi:hypothetical protein RG959_21180 [Domibacillus sp. 8LH]|uniref:hypothetical protein n=1 Tax=Domibacillus sp. 8LH TaxID=3073900 RepID=UPI003180C7E2